MSTADTTNSNLPPGSGPSAAKAPKRYSCVLCAQRKVKCDKKYPCSTCAKARVECVFRAPAPPRRRKKRVTEADLLARLDRCEKLLKQNGINIDPVDGDDHATGNEEQMDRVSLGEYHTEAGQVGSRLRDARSPVPDNGGKLILPGGSSRYLENSLWTGLSDEFADTNEMFHGQSEDGISDPPTPSASDLAYPEDGGDLIFGSTSLTTTLQNLHPQPVQIFRLWQAFLDNVDPIIKLFHTPTVQQAILEASANLEAVPKGLEALMFAIYSCSVGSLSDVECESIMGEEKSMLAARYRYATKQALARAGFLQTSELSVLQALVLFIISVRDHYDPRASWVLVGIAIRIGQRIGLHHDGVSLGISPFETEMRRRLWLQIVLLDALTGELCGVGLSILHRAWDTKTPSNFNDRDLNPNMTEFPVEHSGPTEMIYCRVHCEVGECLRNTIAGGAFDAGWQGLSTSSIPTADKDKAIDEFERVLERRIVRHCDPSIPLHFLTTLVAKGAICRMRLVAHRPRQFTDKGVSCPQSDRDVVFSCSLKMIEIFNLAQSTTCIQRFMWNIKNHFQWRALVAVLRELRDRTSGDAADAAWRQVGQVFEFRPEVITRPKMALYIAIGNLTLKAWEAREAAYLGQHPSPQHPSSPRPSPPGFITILRSQRMKNVPQTPPTFNMPMDFATGEQLMGDAFTQNYGTLPVNMTTGFDPSLLPNPTTTLIPSPTDWSDWDNLIRDFELPNTNENLPCQ
ncbi:MAG: hypothetical protein M1834_005795 [Cirrosporium novae-zelandiae]|nr:MAG: hypothetical protein M1834_005795 [Cirrosporium novae-zelandiae]